MAATKTPRRKPPTGKPKGRPSAIHRTIALPNGTTSSVAARIVQLMANGCYAERAAAEAGIPKSTFYGWLTVATNTREKLLRLPNYQPTVHEQACVDLSDAVDQAEALYEMTSLAALEAIAHGQIQLQVITEKYEPDPDQPGGTKLVERRVKTTGMTPNPHVIMWKLTRRFPERYQLVPNLGAATPPPGSPLDQPVEFTSDAAGSLMDEIEEFVREFNR